MNEQEFPIRIKRNVVAATIEPGSRDNTLGFDITTYFRGQVQGYFFKPTLEEAQEYATDYCTRLGGHTEQRYRELCAMLDSGDETSYPPDYIEEAKALRADYEKAVAEDL